MECGTQLCCVKEGEPLEERELLAVLSRPFPETWTRVYLLKDAWGQWLRQLSACFPSASPCLSNHWGWPGWAGFPDHQDTFCLLRNNPLQMEPHKGANHGHHFTPVLFPWQMGKARDSPWGARSWRDSIRGRTWTALISHFCHDSVCSQARVLHRSHCTVN